MHEDFYYSFQRLILNYSNPFYNLLYIKFVILENILEDISLSR